MNKIVYALLVIGFVLAGCATTQKSETTRETESSQTQSGPSDVEIESSIRSALQQDELLANSDIQVDANNGVVILSGSVPNGRAMNRAISLARAVPGVRRLDVNQLQLR